MNKSLLNLEYLKKAIDNFEDAWSTKREAIIARPANMCGFTIARVLEILGETVLADQSRSEIYRFLFLATDVGVANFVSSVHAGKTISLPLGFDRIEFIGESTTANMHVDVWLKTFFAAVVCRDQNAIRYLCDVPEEIFKSANIRPDVFDLAFVQLCKGLFDPSVNIGQLLVDAMAACTHGRVTEMRLGYVSPLYLPVVELFQYALDGDPDGDYEVTLHAAIKEHVSYWTDDENKGDSYGWFSLPLLAAAVLAYDSKGLKFEKESELVPRWLVENFDPKARISRARPSIEF